MSNTDTSKTILLPDQKELLTSLKDIRLGGFADELLAQFENPALYQDLSFEERLKRCMDSQREFADKSKFRNLVKNSRIKTKIYLKQFVPSPSRGLSSELLLMLRDGDYLEKGINFVICGQTGTGKTALAFAIALEAMLKGYTALFYRMSDLSTIIETKDAASFSRFKEKLKRIKCLILDDYGLVKIGDNIAYALNEIADIRYGIGTTIITSQLKKKALKSVITECPVRDALADRLLRNCDIEIVLKGDSWRGSGEEFKGDKSDE